MANIRNSIKAIIIEEGKILFNKMVTDETFYILPGGGQELEETFIETLKRECREELGAEVKVSELVLVREYIGKNHEFAEKHSGCHQIEYMFRCKLVDGVHMSKVKQLDAGQVGHEWIELSQLKEWNVYPKILKEVIDEKGNILGNLYLGDIN